MRVDSAVRFVDGSPDFEKVIPLDVIKSTSRMFLLFQLLSSCSDSRLKIGLTSTESILGHVGVRPGGNLFLRFLTKESLFKRK
jgi:hypothetical protein